MKQRFSSLDVKVSRITHDSMMTETPPSTQWQDVTEFNVSHRLLPQSLPQRSSLSEFLISMISPVEYSSSNLPNLGDESNYSSTRASGAT